MPLAEYANHENCVLFLFSTLLILNKLFHITDVYIYTTQDKIIAEFIKYYPVQKFTES